jgi:lipopolysaccharide export system protein LptA
VHGDGAMKMESATNFQGEKLDHPVPLTVHWSKSMLFNGTSAEYQGNIQAVQEKARLACQHLQVYFDRTISLKQGNKSDQPAKVRTLVCDRDVRIEEHVYQGEKLVKYQRLEGPAVEMRAQEPDDEPAGRPVVRPPGARTSAGNLVYASGPGNIRVLEQGSADPLLVPTTPGARPAPAAKPAAPRAAGGEMKMTYVAFQNRMDANSRKNTAQFWGNVRIINFPCNRHDTVIDLDVMLAADLPDKAVYMRCDRLRVLDSTTDGKSNKEMWAHGKVYVQGREFYARADTVTYNQAKEQVIFHGEESGMATLYKIDQKGGKPQLVEARKIIYNRTTGEIRVEGAREATGG